MSFCSLRFATGNGAGGMDGHACCYLCSSHVFGVCGELVRGYLLVGCAIQKQRA
jgi:hypothetical protein